MRFGLEDWPMTRDDRIFSEFIFQHGPWASRLAQVSGKRESAEKRLTVSEVPATKFHHLTDLIDSNWGMTVHSRIPLDRIKGKEEIQRHCEYQPQCASLDNPDSSSGTTTATLFAVIVGYDSLAVGQKSVQDRDHRR